MDGQRLQATADPQHQDHHQAQQHLPVLPEDESQSQQAQSQHLLLAGDLEGGSHSEGHGVRGNLSVGSLHRDVLIASSLHPLPRRKAASESRRCASWAKPLSGGVVPKELGVADMASSFYTTWQQVPPLLPEALHSMPHPSFKLQEVAVSCEATACTPCFRS
ncbi:hypothetical protein cyc_00355 [Cyclospora cayetanensis]|uniref:Uncharacterized protein n=1 Tax=Cyclospora cayetanensis TaxID=88456 RepID=A0A1D3D8G9_9EIME|nr:hypothetical protein cyc_00355 [Cyclospora cayetanensis]